MQTAPKRTLDQNAKFHAMVRDIAEQVKVSGELRGERWWKVFLVAAHGGQEIIAHPWKGGEFVVMPKIKSTRELLKPGASDFISELYAFGADNGVEWTHEPQE